jgi:YD repeat-containing protein
MRSGLGKVLVMFLGVAISILVSIIISHAQSVNYYYDDLNRLTRIDYGDTVIDYTYDDVGNRQGERIAHPPITTATPAGRSYGASQTVTLTCADPQGPGCGNIYYTTDGSTPTTSSAVYSSPILISATATLKFFARDLSSLPVNGTVKALTYTIDTDPPTGTIVIQGGAESTTGPNVTLTLTCSDSAGCSQMRFSNDNLTYSTPQAYGTSSSWTLEACDGDKIVYVKFQDTAGNWSNRKLF